MMHTSIRVMILLKFGRGGGKRTNMNSSNLKEKSLYTMYRIHQNVTIAMERKGGGGYNLLPQ